jgi:hypothetical protein
VSVKIGTRGKASLRYSCVVRPQAITARFTPEVHAKVYGHAAVDAEVVSAGVAADLTLVDFNLSAGGDLAVNDDAAKGPYLTEHLYCHDAVTLVKGSLYAFAKVDLWLWDHEWRHNFWDSKGLEAKGWIFNYRKRTSLGGPAPMVANKSVKK